MLYFSPRRTLIHKQLSHLYLKKPTRFRDGPKHPTLLQLIPHFPTWLFTWPASKKLSIQAPYSLFNGVSWQHRWRPLSPQMSLSPQICTPIYNNPRVIFQNLACPLWGVEPSSQCRIHENWHARFWKITLQPIYYIFDRFPHYSTAPFLSMAPLPGCYAVLTIPQGCPPDYDSLSNILFLVRTRVLSRTQLRDS